MSILRGRALTNKVPGNALSVKHGEPSVDYTVAYEHNAILIHTVSEDSETVAKHLKNTRIKSKVTLKTITSLVHVKVHPALYAAGIVSGQTIYDKQDGEFQISLIFRALNGDVDLTKLEYIVKLYVDDEGLRR